MKYFICALMLFSVECYSQINAKLYYYLDGITDAEVFIVAGNSEEGLTNFEKIVVDQLKAQWKVGELAVITHDEYQKLDETEENYFLSIMGFKNISALGAENMSIKFGTSKKNYFLLFDKGVTKQDQIDMYKYTKSVVVERQNETTYSALLSQIGTNKFYHLNLGYNIDRLSEYDLSSMINLRMQFPFAKINDLIAFQTDDLIEVAKRNKHLVKDKTLYIKGSKLALIDKSILKNPKKVSTVYSYPYEVVEVNKFAALAGGVNSSTGEGLTIFIEMNRAKRQLFVIVLDISTNRIVFIKEKDSKGFTRIDLDDLKAVNTFFNEN